MSKNTTVLVVEDELFNMLYINEALAALKVKIIEAFNGKEAVEYCQKNSDIKLVLMDIKMPIMNGLEATKLIKNKHPKLPIIAVSAFVLPSDIEKALAIGCDSYVEKPINRKQLLSEIDKFLPKS